MSERIRNNQSRAQVIAWGICIIGGLALALAFKAVAMPAAALLGPVVISTIVGVRGGAIRVPKSAHRMAQGVAGCLIAQYLSADLFLTLSDDWWIFGAFVLATLSMAMVVGLMVGRMTSVPPEEAIWGFLPGMAGAMIAMSEEQGVDSRYVAFMQITRLLVVIVTMAGVSALLVDVPPLAIDAHPEDTSPWTVVVTLLVAASGFPVKRWLPGFPSSNALVPMIVAGVMTAGFGIPLPLPGWMLMLAFFLIGCDVGLKFTPALVRYVAHELPALILASLGLMLACAMSGALLSLILDVPLMTALLATVPGSVETVAIIAINAHADVTFVMTLQTLRLFAVVFAGPLLAKRICRGLAARAPGEQPP